MKNEHHGHFSPRDLVSPAWHAFNTLYRPLLENCEVDELARLLKAGRYWVAKVEEVLRRRLGLPDGYEPLLLLGPAREAWLWRHAHRLARSYTHSQDVGAFLDGIHVLAVRVEERRLELLAQEQEAERLEILRRAKAAREKEAADGR